MITPVSTPRRLGPANCRVQAQFICLTGPRPRSDPAPGGAFHITVTVGKKSGSGSYISACWDKRLGTEYEQLIFHNHKYLIFNSIVKDQTGAGGSHQWQVGMIKVDNVIIINDRGLNFWAEKNDPETIMRWSIMIPCLVFIRNGRTSLQWLRDLSKRATRLTRDFVILNIVLML